ncbi:hypothetical protein [Streptomyces pratensis]|uniref:hypothetical protein n=1 Tax=Streptomyces pratensis TaxID=1169025 RepID=UPI001933685C|nr:hypothetical protein [Streptomyces pratensis]
MSFRPRDVCVVDSVHTIAHQLKAAGSGAGVATPCTGVAQGSALVPEAPDADRAPARRA